MRLFRVRYLAVQGTNVSTSISASIHLISTTVSSPSPSHKAQTRYSSKKQEKLTKNCALFVSAPAFAMASIPRLLNLSVDRISSGKGRPQIDCPPLPVPVGSPVWIMKFLMFLFERRNGKERRGR